MALTAGRAVVVSAAEFAGESGERRVQIVDDEGLVGIGLHCSEDALMEPAGGGTFFPPHEARQIAYAILQRADLAQFGPRGTYMNRRQAAEALVDWPTAEALARGIDARDLLPLNAPAFAGKRVRVLLEVIDEEACAP